MIGTLRTSDRRATVIGAGVSGLLMAYRLDQLGYEVSLYEASDRAGGLISTRRTPYGIAEAAAHSLLVSPPVAELFQDLGISLYGLRPGSHARYIYRQGKMRRFPLTFWEAVGILWRLLFQKAKPGQWQKPVTLEDWGRQFAGQAAVDYGLSPMLRGIYASRPSELDVRAVFPKLLIPEGRTVLSHRLEQNRAWRKTSPHTPRPPRAKIQVPAEGMESLTRALESRLEQRLGERFKRRSPITTLPEAHNLVICTPASIAGQLLSKDSPELSKALQEVRYAPLISVTVFLSSRLTPRQPKGVGVLIPEKEPSEILGVLFNSSAFEGRVAQGEDVSSYTVMLGGTSRPDLLQRTDAEIRDVVRREMSRLFGAEVEPLYSEITRWESAIPIYSSALLQTWELARATWCEEPGRILFGNYTGQVSIRGMIETLATLSG